jgi:peptidoglycan/LPS O-acetylase OafA/YrhL
MSIESASSDRNIALDGVRGLAAAGVLLSHLFWGFFVQFHNPSPDDPVSLFVGSTPLSAFYNGQFSVYIFFVLSGFVLSASAAGTQLSLPSILVRRYFRLTVPVLMITLIYIITAHLSLFYNRTLPANNAPLLRDLYPDNFSPTVGYWLTNSLFGVYATGKSDINGALWTMKVEIWGSLLVYVTWFLLKNQVARMALSSAVMVGLFFLNKDSSLQGLQLFPVGIILYDLSHFRCDREETRSWPIWVGIIVLLFGISLGAWRVKEPVLPGANLVTDLLLDPIFGHVSRYEAQQIGGVLVVAAFVFTTRLQFLLSNALGRFLGQISFPLYLSHILIIASFGSALFAWSDSYFGTTTARLVTIPITFVAAIAFATVLAVLVEKPAVAASRRVGARCETWLHGRRSWLRPRAAN